MKIDNPIFTDIPSKTPIDTDIVLGQNSASSFSTITSTWTTVKTFLKTYFDTLYLNQNTTGNASTSTTATNLAGGSGGAIPYQSSAGTTAMLSNGTAGQVLKSNGTTLAPSWITLTGGGDALTSNPLSQFASTTSSQLAGVMSDETGSGALVFATSPAFTTPVLGTPTSGDLQNCTGATLTTKGVVEFATATEINTGTDSTRAIPVDQWVASNRNIRYMVIKVIESATDVSTGTTLGGDFECPITGTIVSVGAWNDTAGTTGTAIYDINIGGTTIMTTNKIQIETTEKSSRDAITQPTLTTTSVTAGNIFTFDCDTAQTTKAKGLTFRIGIRES